MALFDEKDEELVKKFLFNKIEKESDADPGIMTDYILVTLQNEMSESELKAHCMTDLSEFFGDQTSVFVASLFEALGRKQYLLNAEGASASEPKQQQQQQQRRENGHSSRRRSRSPDHHGRSLQRERERERDRRGRSSRSPSRERRMPAASSAHDLSLLNGPLEPAPGTMMFANMQQQQPQIQNQQNQNQQRRRKPCFEFMRRGNCQRGDACNYAHVTPEQAQMMGMMAPGGGGGGAFVPMQHQQQQQRGGPYMMGPGMMGQPQQRPPAGAGGFYPMGMRPPGMHMQQGGGGGGGGPGSYDGNQPMSTTAVFVTNIPDESLGEGSVREFFERFGAIQDLRIDANRHTAMIEYGDSSAQAQALSTPEAIFNNRFVRVHKARQQQQPQQQQQQQHANGEAGGYQQRPPASASAAQPPVWRPKSATIKKAEMIERFVEQQKELMKKLTTIKDMPPATRKIIMDSINQIQKKIDDIRRPPAAGAAAAAAAAGAAAKAAITEDNSNDSVDGGPPSAAESQPEQRMEVSAVEAEKQALQAKLKALQVEAARLGMARGGGNSRGRGGRGGGFASASSSHHGSMSLDKRPRTLVLRNVGQAAAERLDSEMAQFGEIEHIDKTEDRNDPPFTYAVKYKARWEAEAAMRAVTSIDAFSDVSADWEQ